MQNFVDRHDAGKQLGNALQEYRNQPETVAIGLPRGGVVTAYEVAQALNLPLDIIVTRKIGAPFQPELAVGAITQSGKPLFNDGLIREANITRDSLLPVIEREKQEIKRRLSSYRSEQTPLDLNGKTALIIDDGIATGATMRAAIDSAHELGAKKIVIAAPVASIAALEKMQGEVDECICLLPVESFPGISYFYANFKQVEDDEVKKYLETSRRP